MNNPITVQTVVHVDLSTAWEYFTNPKHIVNWNYASDDWECTAARNDLVEGGKFVFVMGAKDKSTSFEFGGTYTKIEAGKVIESILDDGRRLVVSFEEIDGSTRVTEVFEPESENSEEMQRSGWQAILDNFRKYAESDS
ncbi:MAG: SRPBCC domain-containing protein [Candidatus Moranbacteria bacterium]|nr:SRPBCC domain-containing protein [Candidatus Moranbacteria bacterium]